MKEQAFCKMDEIEWETVENGIRRKIGPYSDDMMAVVVDFDKGAIGALHSHRHTQVSFVNAGSFEVTIAGKKETLKKGDFFFAKPNAEHGVEALEAGQLIDIFNPMREDFV